MENTCEVDLRFDHDQPTKRLRNDTGKR